MTKEEAMSLALKAMKYADACLKKQLTTKDKHEYAQDLLLEAGAAIEKALAQQADHSEQHLDMVKAQPEPVAWAMYQKGRLLSFWMDKGDAYDFEFTSEHRWEPLYTTPPKIGCVNHDCAQCKAQPVQKRPQNCGTGYCSCVECVMEPEQEPVAWIDIDENDVHSGLRYWSEPDNRHQVALCKCSPPQRTWVGLTDEEFQMIYDMGRTPAGMMEMVEAKLKEKNT